MIGVLPKVMVETLNTKNLRNFTPTSLRTHERTNPRNHESTHLRTYEPTNGRNAQGVSGICVSTSINTLWHSQISMGHISVRIIIYKG